jgi:hypothetical protein
MNIYGAFKYIVHHFDGMGIIYISCYIRSSLFCGLILCLFKFAFLSWGYLFIFFFKDLIYMCIIFKEKSFKILFFQGYICKLN